MLTAAEYFYALLCLKKGMQVGMVLFFPRLFHKFQVLVPFALNHPVAVIVCREFPLSHLFTVLSHGIDDHLGHVCVLLDELRGECLTLPYHVRYDEQLAVAIW